MIASDFFVDIIVVCSYRKNGYDPLPSTISSTPIDQAANLPTAPVEDPLNLPGHSGDTLLVELQRELDTSPEMRAKVAAMLAAYNNNNTTTTDTLVNIHLQ